jgi:hypothetical protein
MSLVVMVVENNYLTHQLHKKLEEEMILHETLSGHLAI